MSLQQGRNFNQRIRPISAPARDQFGAGLFASVSQTRRSLSELSTARRRIPDTYQSRL